MDPFRSILLEGLFYQASGQVCVQGVSGSPSNLVEMLAPFEGQRVRLVAHHQPPTPIEHTRWGGGCCRWQPADCPAGHHLNPAYLFCFSGIGVLTRVPEGWQVQAAEKTETLSMTSLIGHAARMVLVSDMEPPVGGSTDPDLSRLLELGDQVEDLKRCIANLRGFLKSED